MGAESWNGIVVWEGPREPGRDQSRQGFEDHDKCAYVCGTWSQLYFETITPASAQVINSMGQEWMQQIS